MWRMRPVTAIFRNTITAMGKRLQAGRGQSPGYPPCIRWCGTCLLNSFGGRGVSGGKELTEEVLEQAASIAVKDACSFDKNDYKIQEMKALLKKALRAVR